MKIDPKVLDDWIRLLKPGGFICFTHTNDVKVKWESYQTTLVTNKRWKKIWKSCDMYFMPSCDKEDIKTRATVYVYKKLD